MNPPIVYEVTNPSAQRTSKMTAMVQSIFLTSCRDPTTSIRKGAASSKLPRRTLPGQLREVCLPALTHVDEDVDGVRRIQREESPCQPQQVLVVVHPFIYSQFQYGPNGMPGVITEIAAVIQSIHRDRSHRCFLSFRPSIGRRPHSSDYLHGNPARQPSVSASIRNASRRLS